MRAPMPVIVALCLALCFALSACGGKPEAGGGPPPPAVNVAQVVKKNVREWDEFSGNIEAMHTVEIRPRVSGYLAEVSFEEGAMVEKGQVLYRIDDSEYRAALERAEAEVLRAKSQLDIATSRGARADRLQQANAISTEEADDRRAEAAQAKANVRAAEAARNESRIQLDFTVIHSPIAGRASRTEVRAGNLVNGDGAGQATLLTRIVSVDPMHVTFNGDEAVYLKYQRLNKEGKRPSSRLQHNPVRVALGDETEFTREGTMDFVDNAIDPATGTIRGRAIIPNPDGYMTPGMFARLQLLGSGEYEAMLISDRAVMTDQDRKFVYVLGPENKALRKDVVLGSKVDGLRVVSKGLEATDIVVVNGAQKIFFPGMAVVPNTVPMDDPEQAPPAAPAPAAAATP